MCSYFLSFPRCLSIGLDQEEKEEEGEVYR